MDARETKTLDAALRLFKSTLRLHAYQQRPAWEPMLPLEEAVLSEAQTEWQAVLSGWDRKNASAEVRLRTLTAEAFFRSLQDVVHFLEEFNSAEAILGILIAYAEKLGWVWALDQEGACKSATS